MGCGTSTSARANVTTAPPIAPAPAAAPPAVTKTPDTVESIQPVWLAAGKPQLTLEAADEMANGAIREAKDRSFKDISVYVLDANGRTVVSKTMVNCPSLPQQLAHAKAMACISTHSSSRALKDKYVPERTPQLMAMTTIGTSVQQPLAAVPGGVLIRDADKTVVGAIGVSGASADEDEHCALVGARVLGLLTEPAASALAA